MPRCVLAAAVLGSSVPDADEKRVAQVMGAIADRVTDQFVNPYTFPSLHKRILEPYNYYKFGQVTIRDSLHLRYSSAQKRSLPCCSLWCAHVHGCMSPLQEVEKLPELLLN